MTLYEKSLPKFRKFAEQVMLSERIDESTALYILQVIDRQDFIDWYEGNFQVFISMDDDAPSKEEIIQQISDFFRIPKGDRRAQQFLNVLSQEDFHQWYTSEFESFISMDDDAPSKEEIFEQIENLFWDVTL